MTHLLPNSTKLTSHDFVLPAIVFTRLSAPSPRTHGMSSVRLSRETEAFVPTRGMVKKSIYSSMEMILMRDTFLAPVTSATASANITRTTVVCLADADDTKHKASIVGPGHTLSTHAHVVPRYCMVMDCSYCVYASVQHFLQVYHNRR